MSARRNAIERLFNPIGKKRQKNEALIIAAAEDEFVTHGFEGSSMARIAERSDLPRPNVHYYFKNKLELYATVLSDIVQLWNDAFNDIRPEDDPAEALDAYIRAKIEYSRTNGKASRIFASEIIHGAPHLSAYLKSDFQEWIQGKASVIQTWVDQGKMDDIEPMHLLFVIWGATQHYANFSVEVEAALGHKLQARDYEAAAENLSRIILRGCGLEFACRSQT